MATFYYDESNNHRKLWIDPERRAYNIDKDDGRKVPVGRNFVLGGVVHYGVSSTCDVPSLITSLKISRNTDEVKFKRIASGDFDSCLKSDKVGPLLKWVIDSDLYLHFFNINLEYWAFLDIVDDCLMWCHERGLSFELRFPEEVDSLKDALYRVIRMDRAAFLDLANSFGYPNLDGKTAAFVARLAGHVEGILSSTAHMEELEEVGLREAIERLLVLLEVSEGIDDMTLCQMDDDGVLVDGFGFFYDFTTTVRSNDSLVMDMEVHVKNYMDTRTDLGKVPPNLRFSDSRKEELIQVSDLVTGLVARYLQFIDDHNHQWLAEWQARLNKWQIENLALLRKLLDKSHEQDPMLLHRVVARSEIEKSMLVLYPDHFHEHL